MSYKLEPNKIPGWTMACLDKSGIPQTFTEEALTEKQKESLVTIMDLYVLVEAGIVKVEYDREDPVVSLVEPQLSEDEEDRRINEALQKLGLDQEAEPEAMEEVEE